MYKLGLILTLTVYWSASRAQIPQGYDLWMSYSKVEDQSLANRYKNSTKSIYFKNDSEILSAARAELTRGLESMLGEHFKFADKCERKTTLLVAKISDLESAISTQLGSDANSIGNEGFLIKSVAHHNHDLWVITAKEDQGILYGVFRFLQLMQSGCDIKNLTIVETPKINLRMLNHWDNLDRSIERGYAGFSIWNWQKLPDYIDERYIDYARANASVGINATVLTNVNANALVLTPTYLEKVAALANVFRPYGIKVFLTARFSAPIEIGGLETADPLNAEVQEWWNKKAAEIYSYVPDFGGFLVKANSEGQPGPHNYGRTHADGANMLAKALKPHEGIVIWRSFVYSEYDADDRAKHAYSEFVPLDGQFLENVLVQSKNGPIDFQPREPFHPMFGAMPNTPLMIEFQITQEYLGFSSHMVFLPKLFEEVLQSDTHLYGKGSTVAKVVEGEYSTNKLSGIAGVSNVGNDLNWTGHPFAQANWYGFGRLAWDPSLSAETIAEEWLKLTYSSDPKFIAILKPILLMSREAVVNYMMPLGLHHLFDTNHHYGPGPWVGTLSRPEWNPTYYHNADEYGIGFDRTPSGSNATSQYAPDNRELFNNLSTCPEEYLLWFHHLPWDYTLKNGSTLWEGLAFKYQEGVNQVEEIISAWDAAQAYLTADQYKEVEMLLKIQLEEAKWWRDACLLYFQQFSKMEIPKSVEKPAHTLEYYQSLKFPFAPGIRPQWD